MPGMCRFLFFVFFPKRAFPAVWLFLPLALAASCAVSPIKSVYLEHGIRDVSIPAIQENQNLYKGRLFLLGGIILNTQVTDEGSLVYAIYVPVDSEGTPMPLQAAGGRYIALWPKSYGTLEPSIYKKNLEITVAGEFVGLRKGKLDKADYDYPVFRIEQIYLWHGEQYAPAYYYPYYYYAPYYSYPYNYPYYNYPYYYNSPYYRYYNYPYNRPYYRPGPYYWRR